MANWKSCKNCRDRTCFAWLLHDNIMVSGSCDDWEPIPCPLCGGSLSEVKEHKTKVGNEEVIRHYRHCYSCHMEFYEEEE